MKKKALQEAAELTNHTTHRLRNDKDVTTETTGKICKALNCQVEDIIDFIEIEKQ